MRPLEFDVQSEPSVNVAVDKLIAESGRIGVVVHNAGHMMFGPAEAFTPEQLPSSTTSMSSALSGSGAVAHMLN
ncbi:hypothetical protein ACO2I3_17295 [Leptospira interrogans]